jgi:hypothetical protein
VQSQFHDPTNQFHWNPEPSSLCTHQFHYMLWRFSVWTSIFHPRDSVWDYESKLVIHLDQNDQFLEDLWSLVCCTQPTNNMRELPLRQTIVMWTRTSSKTIHDCKLSPNQDSSHKSCKVSHPIIQSRIIAMHFPEALRHNFTHIFFQTIQVFHILPCIQHLPSLRRYFERSTW